MGQGDVYIHQLKLVKKLALSQSFFVSTEAGLPRLVNVFSWGQVKKQSMFKHVATIFILRRHIWIPQKFLLRLGSGCFVLGFLLPFLFSQYSFVQAIHGRQVPPKDATFAGLPSVVHHPEPGVEHLSRHKRVIYSRCSFI